MNQIDAGLAGHGYAVMALSQTSGKGQRGRIWQDEPGKSLLMSLVVAPKFSLDHQFLFNATITVAIAKVLQKSVPGAVVNIKWPNDIIINDKKTAGILIENVLRGANWNFSVIGLGVNVFQESFPDILPHATSLKLNRGAIADLKILAEDIRTAILAAHDNYPTHDSIMAQYNSFLFRKNEFQRFSKNGLEHSAKILEATGKGTLKVIAPDGTTTEYIHGDFTWEY